MRAMVLFLILGAGIVASLQIGKAIIAVPVVQAEMGLSLVEVSALLSTFAIFGATIGMPSGVLVPRLGGKRALLSGLALITAGNLLGIASGSFGPLLASRFVEGIGFIVIATAAPLLLARATSEVNRGQVFAVWGIYMPAGMGIMILASVLVDIGNWRLLWALNAALAAVWLLAVAAILPRDPDPAATGADRQPFQTLPSLLRAFWRDRAPFAVMAAFFFYANLYFGVVGLFPAFLIERFDLALGAVAPLTALIVFANMGGNLAAGALLHRGFAFHRVMLGSFAVAALLCIAIFLLPRSAGQAVALAALAFGAAGLFPASVMASAPLLTRDLRYVGAMIGLFMQGSTLGQFTGPPAFSLVVEELGWSMSWLFVAIVGSAGLALTFVLGRIRDNRAPGADPVSAAR